MQETIKELVQHICGQSTFNEDAAFAGFEMIVDYDWSKKLVQLLGRLAESVDQNVVTVCQIVMVFDPKTGRITQQDESGNGERYWTVDDIDYAKQRRTYFPNHKISEVNLELATD